MQDRLPSWQISLIFIAHLVKYRLKVSTRKEHSVKKTLSITLMIVLLTGALLSGCGGDSATTGAGSQSPPVAQLNDVPNPCTLVTKADMEAITGEPVGQPQTNATEASSSCDYSVLSDGRIAGLTIIKPCSMADFFNMGSGDPVEGVGMHAAWDKNQLTVHTMNNACLVASGGGAPKGADPNSDTAAVGTAKLVALKAIENGA